ncbi:MAG: phospholipase D-like domain-containing protein [Candidatus Odinarchaeota archaeon]
MKKKATLAITIAVLAVTVLGTSNTGLLVDDYLISRGNLNQRESIAGITGILAYTPKFTALNMKESMTLSPMFTPDNALDIHKWWIDKATTSIDIQNPYITQFDDTKPWADDPNPIVEAIVRANTTRGVSVRVQVNELADSDHVTAYLQSVGIDVRWMGNSESNPDNQYLSDTHNKLVIIDNEVVLTSSINFGENAFTNNRESGMVIQSATAAAHFSEVFQSDWEDGENPPAPLLANPAVNTYKKTSKMALSDYTSHTNIPLTNFTGTYNITLFTNPDNADEVIFRYLKAAKESIYVSMYTISRPDFNKTLIDLKKANPAMDIQVLISNRRVGSGENVDTKAAAESLVANLIPVYNSTTDADKVNGYYHNKYWIIDGKHVFVYSGNWSPRSVTPEKASYTSSESNRDMGVAVHDAPNIAKFFKEEVWDKDVAVGSAWELPIGIKQTCFSTADVISGEVTISAQSLALDDPDVYYRWGEGSYTEVTDAVNGSFSKTFDTTILSDGITTFEVKAVNASGTGATFTNSVKVNIVNEDKWKVLITEVLPDPSEVPDEEGEFIELTNSFPFAVLIEGWQVGDDKDLHTFTKNYDIAASSSIIIARDLSAFQAAYGVTADIELDFALTNTGDYVQFLNAHGEFVDVVAYGSATAPDGSEATSKPGAGESIHRTDFQVDTDKASDFHLGSPDPKGAGLETSYSWVAFLGAIALLPIIRSKRRKSR